MKLVFGVHNERYGDDPVTTGDVANRLEDRYHIMETYVSRNKKMIAKEVMEEILGTKGRRTLHPMDALQKGLKQAISNREFDGLPGVPTKAAQMGVSSRFKNGKRRGKSKVSGVPRPSFIDSGIFQNAIRVVLDESK
jgi:hypothetical protein